MTKEMREILADIAHAQRVIAGARERCERSGEALGSVIWSLDWAETELDKAAAHLTEAAKEVQP